MADSLIFNIDSVSDKRAKKQDFVMKINRLQGIAAPVYNGAVRNREPVNG
jgi:hypothetical protein